MSSKPPEAFVEFKLEGRKGSAFPAPSFLDRAPRLGIEGRAGFITVKKSQSGIHLS